VVDGRWRFLMTNRPRARSAGKGVCVRCNAPKPAGRTRYCSDRCWQDAQAERAANHARRRMKACARCGGAKELGTRGGKYCAECRRVMADVVTQAEYERARRKRLAEDEANGIRRARRTKDVPDGMKWCARCQDFRPVTSFPARKVGGKPAAYCRPCQRAYNRERNARIKFGLDADEYEMLLACQDYRCAICGGLPRKNALAIDHDHETGEIRGLLCSRCNHKLLGAANDSAARLRTAADYLEAYGARDVFGEPRYVPGFSEPERVA